MAISRTSGSRFAFTLLMATALLGALPAPSALAGEGTQSLFDGKSLSGWRPMGASWDVRDGEISGRAGRGGQGGWLTLDQPYEDFNLQFWFRCAKPCETGVLSGVDPAGGEQSGTYVSLRNGALGAATLTIDSRGREIGSKPMSLTADPAMSFVTGLPPPKSYAPPAGHPYLNEAQGPQYYQDSWNHVEIRAVGSTLQAFLNNRAIHIGPVDRPSRYGRIAIRLADGNGAELRLRDIRLHDLTVSPNSTTAEQLSPEFTLRRVATTFNGYGELVADINRDGVPDIVAGATYYLGPDFKVARELEDTKPMDPTGYVAGMTLGQVVSDFTGDGWPDILMTDWPAGSPGYLYVNPGKEPRRWQRFTVLPNVDGELFALSDIDNDGKPEFIFASDGTINVARPDPKAPTKPWIIERLTEEGPWGKRNAHGLGVGDVNGDGKQDLLNAWGWWEQPADWGSKPWRFHPVAFGRSPQPGNPGGSQMYAYDVNGDGLNDVVTSLEGHGRGLAWFEQKRDAAGAISFDRQMIMDIDPEQSGGVVFSEMHTLAVVDVDGDGLKDIVTGKNKTNIAHWNPFSYVDSDNDGVIYWFKLTRSPSGEVKFDPKLVYNRSGIGRHVQVSDINKDGKLDIVTNTRTGIYVFYGKESGK